jgi:hypothetical protein
MSYVIEFKIDGKPNKMIASGAYAATLRRYVLASGHAADPQRAIVSAPPTRITNNDQEI